MKAFLFLSLNFCLVFPSFSKEKVPVNILHTDTTKVKNTTKVIASKDSTKTTTKVVAKKDTSSNSNQSLQNDSNYGWKERTAIILGAGISTNLSQLYNDPVINKTNNHVIIEKAQELRTSLSLGIVFTPFVYNVPRKIFIPAGQKGFKNDTTISVAEYYPKKLSFGVFLNPVSISKIGDSGFINNIDLGFGIGWRSEDWLFMTTIDFFSIKQPREYFVTAYQNKEATYIINSQVQSTIDLTDTSIFHNVIVPSIGFKMAYTFNLAKSLFSNSQLLPK